MGKPEKCSVSCIYLPTYLTIKVIKDPLPLLLAHLGVNGLGRDVDLLEVLYLVLDEGDEGGDHDGHLTVALAPYGGRQLVHQRLPAS